jgi:hypothetical protein
MENKVDPFTTLAGQRIFYIKSTANLFPTGKKGTK